jgi:hypothetical protein
MGESQLPEEASSRRPRREMGYGLVETRAPLNPACGLYSFEAPESVLGARAYDAAPEPANG